MRASISSITIGLDRFTTYSACAIVIRSDILVLVFIILIGCFTS